MKIKIDIINDKEKMETSKVILNYSENGEKVSKEIKIKSNEINEYCQDNQSVAFDLLLFAVIVYNTDCLISRYKYSIDGWRREFEVDIPVVNIKEWTGKEELFERMTSFLTGDFWKFNFVENKEEMIIFSKSKKTQSKNIKEIEQVCLFSGGLDSLVGVLSLVNDGRKTLLCSHYVRFERDEQNKIKKLLKEKYNNFDNIQVFCKLEESGKKIEQETTFRSRSLLFLGIAIYVAYNSSENCKVYMPENGTISLNLPLTKSRRGSCSTRTTHPTFIKLLLQNMKSLGIKNQIVNPFEFKTKGELVSDFPDRKLLLEFIEKSVSCGKRGHKRNWDKWKRGGEVKHCGICMPCIYRRVALHMIGKDDEKDYGRDIFTSPNFDVGNLDSDSPDDFRALLHFLSKKYSKDKIEKELLINGMTEIEKISEYAGVVSRTIEQINKWLEDNSKGKLKKTGQDF